MEVRTIKKYNFDEPISREKTNSVKWSFIKENTGDENVLPLWVADMDFETVPEIKQAFYERARHGIYGYTTRPDSYYQVLIDWLKNRHGWEVKKEWVTHSTGVVNAIYNSIYAFSKPGEGVIIQPPVYHPFKKAVTSTGRKVVLNPLKYEGGRYYFDLTNLEEILKKGDASLLILCSPHNPIGRVFTKDELESLGNLCLQYGIKVISDEIHSDFIYKNHKFVPFASISDKFAQISISCTAPSKTFNLAGLATSNIIIPNEVLRNRYDRYCENIGLKSFNIFGAIASETAYKYGESWLDELLVYIEGNKDYAVDYIRKNISELKVVSPEGTYFLWIDFRDLGLSNNELENFLLHDAKLWLNQGYIFGSEGDGFARVNIACRRDTLEKALKRINNAVHSKNQAYSEVFEN